MNNLTFRFLPVVVAFFLAEGSASAAGTNAPAGSAPSVSSPVAAKREVLSFNEGWRFHQGDIPFPEIKGHGWSYSHAKAGSAPGAAAKEYNDVSWRVVNLPHDWAVEGPYDQ